MSPLLLLSLVLVQFVDSPFVHPSCLSLSPSCCVVGATATAADGEQHFAFKEPDEW